MAPLRPTILFSILALLSSTLAVPAPHLLLPRQDTSTPHNSSIWDSSTLDSSSWDADAVTRFPIHSSCNITQARLIDLGLNETIELAQHAKNHVLRWGNSSGIYRKYFGNQPSYEVIGAYEIIVNGDKNKTLFRCDNPDGNCAQEGWAGHWRGENATSETVICDLSFQTRRFLSEVCMLGYTVSESPTNVFWASDLMHRLYHLPAIGGGYLEHQAEDYLELLENAEANHPNSTHDSDGLQYFALEAYAHDIAVPGEGCPGPDLLTASDTESATAEAAAQTSGTPTTTQVSSLTSTLPEGCHTHEGGDVHCP